MKRFVLVMVLLIGFLSVAKVEFARAEPKTWTVDDDGPADFHKVQEAINAAVDGDAIFVHNGTYHENVVVDKTVSLVGENREKTVIDGGEADIVISVTANNVNMTRFKIQSSTKHSYGIFVEQSFGVRITENSITNTGGAVYLYSGGSSLVSDNIITDSIEGIDANLQSGGNIICNNIIHNGLNGLWVNSRNNVLANNTVTDNGKGIILWAGNNTIVGNTIAVNDHGLLLDGCSNSTIFHNSFVRNRQQVISILSYNAWDDGYPNGGNYWSDYKEADVHKGPNQDQPGSDGIGDKPYNIDGGNRDRYPLMKPVFIREHDLTVTVLVPTSIRVETPTTIQVILCNVGLGNETGVHFELLIDKVTIKSDTVPEFESGLTYTVNQSWTPVTEGVHNVTAYVLPVPEEHMMVNNVISVQTSVYAVTVGPARVYLYPSQSRVTTGTTFAVDVEIGNSTDIYSWQVTIYYRNDILKAVGAAEGPFLTAGGDTLWVRPSINNDYNATHGYIMICCTLLGDIPGVNGSGLLATITFSAGASGYSILRIDLVDTIIFNSKTTDRSIDFEAEDGYVVVAKGTYADLNNDGKVDINDLTIAANVFGSYPGHPRWNPIADINQDNTVDIVDVVIIAENWTAK